jgi:hypothetical protein
MFYQIFYDILYERLQSSHSREGFLLSTNFYTREGRNTSVTKRELTISLSSISLALRAQTLAVCYL